MKRVIDSGIALSEKWSRRQFLSNAGKTGLIFAGSAALPFQRGGFTLSRSRTAGAPPVVDKSNLIVHSVRPEDRETPVELFDSWITPVDRFYVRCHLYTPEVDLDVWELKLFGLVERPVTLKFDDLSKFEQVSEVVTIECAGNGRAFQDPRVAGVQWQKGAIGTAKWTGIRLRDLLMKAGLKPSVRHVAFDGADEPIGSVPDFVRSIPIEKALHPATLLATKMNGNVIPIQHGFPLRLIVPGWEGAASVKWVNRIEARDTEADGHFMKNAYRIQDAYVAPGSAVDPKEMRVIASLNVKSMITAPSDNTTVKAGSVEIRGFAWAGEARVAAVDISTDLGRTWRPATFGKNFARYAWREWTYRWRPRESGAYVVLSRARDNRGRVQPVIPFWNPSGYLWNVIDRIRLNVA